MNFDWPSIANGWLFWCIFVLLLYCHCCCRLMLPNFKTTQLTAPFLHTLHKTFVLSMKMNLSNVEIHSIPLLICYSTLFQRISLQKFNLNVNFVCICLKLNWLKVKAKDIFVLWRKYKHKKKMKKKRFESKKNVVCVESSKHMVIF